MSGSTICNFNAVASKINELVVMGHVSKEQAHSMIAVYLGSLAKDEIVEAVEEAERIAAIAEDEQYMLDVEQGIKS